MQRYGFIALSCVITIIAIVIFATNGTITNISLFGNTMAAPLGVLGAVSFMLGVLATLSLWSIRLQKTQVSQQKQMEWEKQDEKLAKEIASDREKQLEAKIETLETALKSALQKNK